MRKIIFVAVLLSTTGVLRAETFSSRIHSISNGEGDQDHIIRFENGRASFLNRNKKEIFLFTKKSFDKDLAVTVHVGLSNNISSVSLGSMQYPSDEDTVSHETNNEPYTPSIVKDNNSALKLFRNMRRDYTTNGECYNRAHIWTYEENLRSKTNLMKIFMFFTDRYIRKYKYGWWFHVTPMVYLKDLKSPRTLDRRYTSGPRQTKTWSNTFIHSKRTCKVVQKFDDYYMNQQKEDCYHIYTSMYYVKPRDIEKRDLTGVEKTEFVEREVTKAYKNAFQKKVPRRRNS